MGKHKLYKKPSGLVPPFTLTNKVPVQLRPPKLSWALCDKIGVVAVYRSLKLAEKALKRYEKEHHG